MGGDWERIHRRSEGEGPKFIVVLFIWLFCRFCCCCWRSSTPPTFRVGNFGACFFRFFWGCAQSTPLLFFLRSEISICSFCCPDHSFLVAPRLTGRVYCAGDVSFALMICGNGREDGKRTSEISTVCAAALYMSRGVVDWSFARLCVCVCTCDGRHALE